MHARFFIKPKNYTYIAIIATVLGYFYFGNILARKDFNLLFLNYSALFLLYLYLIKKELSWATLIIVSLLTRLTFLTSIPNLSQDFYRFIWDGRMLLNGVNPYIYLPESYLNATYVVPQQASTLVAGMGELNASHYSNYPPLNQFCFYLSALIAKNSILGSIISLRLLIILADFGVLYFGAKLLKLLQLNPKAIFLYLLNPLILIELTGNLHFEGVMIFFLVWAVYLLQKNNLKGAAITFACAISLKLLPLLFLPLFFRYFTLKRLAMFYSIVAFTVVLYFAPFATENLLANYSKTIGLWFGTFEFNGSFYLLTREIGFLIKGYNIIETIGKVTPILVFLFVISLALLKKINSITQLLTAFLVALSFYLFTATTVHPWYIAMLVLLCIFTNYRFPLVWSFTIMLSYSFYKNDTFMNNYWLIFIEYAIVFGYLIWELCTTKKNNYA